MRRHAAKVAGACLALLVACASPAAAKGPSVVAQAACGDEAHAYYFAYGSNVSAPFLHERLKEGDWTDDWHRAGTSAQRPPLDLGCFALDGYAFAYDLRGNPEDAHDLAASVTPSPTARVYGVVWDLAPGDLAKLDIDEDVPRDYRRACVAVVPCDGASGPGRAAWVYVGQPEALSQDGAPSDAYVSLIAEGAHAHNFPPDYVARVVRGRGKSEGHRSGR